MRAAPVQAPAQAPQQPLAPADSLGVGAQKLSTPAQKLPALTLKLPSPGGAEPPQPHPQPSLSISVPPASTMPGASPGPLTAQGSSTVPSLPVRPYSPWRCAVTLASCHAAVSKIKGALLVCRQGGVPQSEMLFILVRLLSLLLYNWQSSFILTIGDNHTLVHDSRYLGLTR